MRHKLSPWISEVDHRIHSRTVHKHRPVLDRLLRNNLSATRLAGTVNRCECSKLRGRSKAVQMNQNCHLVNLRYKPFEPPSPFPLFFSSISSFFPTFVSRNTLYKLTSSHQRSRLLYTMGSSNGIEAKENMDRSCFIPVQLTWY